MAVPDFSTPSRGLFHDHLKHKVRPSSTNCRCRLILVVTTEYIPNVCIADHCDWHGNRVERIKHSWRAVEDGVQEKEFVGVDAENEACCQALPSPEKNDSD